MNPPHASTRAVPLVVFLSHFERLSSVLSKPTHRMARPPERNLGGSRWDWVLEIKFPCQGFVCCLQSPIRSHGRLPVVLGSLTY